MGDEPKTGDALFAPAEDDEAIDANAAAPRLNPASTSLLVAGKYRLLAVLGRGGMADVYLALARGTAGFTKLVVIKKLRAGMAGDPGFVEMFRDEARLSSRLSHSNIVQTYEVAEAAGQFYIAMEYLDGQSLYALWRHVVLDRVEVPPVYWARIIADALRGLHYAHEMRDYDGSPLNVIHRDISPHNVFVTYEGDVKLVDFGIAKAAINATDTESGVLKGKIGYMAMEQGSGKTVDRRADIFSMGVVLWELLAGARLFEGSAIDMLHQMMSGVPRSLASVRPELPKALTEIVDKALEQSPDARFQTADAMREALEAFIHATGARVQQGDIANLVATPFKQVREERKRDVLRFINEVEAVPSSVDVTASIPAMPRSASVDGDGTLSGSIRLGGFGPARSDAETIAAEPSAGAISRERGDSARPSRASGAPGDHAKTPAWRVAAWALVPVALVATALIARVRGESANDLTAGAQASTSPSSADLSVRTDPPSASIFIDDRAAGENPYIARLPADGRTHVVRVEAKGFETSHTPVVLVRDAILDIVLRPSAPAEKDVADAGAPKPPASAAPTVVPTANAKLRPAVKTGGSTISPAPSSAPAPKPKLEEDPWR